MTILKMLFAASATPPSPARPRPGPPQKPRTRAWSRARRWAASRSSAASPMRPGHRSLALARRSAVKPWAGVRPATTNGADLAPQPHISDEPWAQVGPQSEDCLFLNVFRAGQDGPVQAKGTGDAVMVFIHGGSFIRGSGGVPLYDGSNLARRGVVIVTINYRLGRLGYFAHPALSAENADGGRLGNYGLMDQDRRPAVGAEEHQGLRGRPQAGDHLRRERRGGCSADADHDAGRQGPLRARHRRGPAAARRRPRRSVGPCSPGEASRREAGPRPRPPRRHDGAAARHPARRCHQGRRGRPGDRRGDDDPQPRRRLPQGRAAAGRPDDRRQIPTRPACSARTSPWRQGRSRRRLSRTPGGRRRSTRARPAPSPT